MEFLMPGWWWWPGSWSSALRGLGQEKALPTPWSFLSFGSQFLSFMVFLQLFPFFSSPGEGWCGESASDGPGEPQPCR